MYFDFLYYGAELKWHGDKKAIAYKREHKTRVLDWDRCDNLYYIVYGVFEEAI
jgi:hypothetical protein